MTKSKLTAATVALFLVIGGVSFAASQAGEDSLLSQSWTTMQTASLYQRYKKQNPGEASRLEAYWANGGTVPSIATAFGKALLLEAQAYWSLHGTPTPADTTPPVVSLTSPTNGATVSGTITVSANATDNVGVTKVEFSRDGTVFATDTTAPYSVSFDTATVANGTHTFGPRAYDAAGNATSGAAVTVTVSNITPPPPTGQLYLAPNGSDANPCTQAAPCLTMSRAYTLAQPGQTVILADGTYPAGQSLGRDSAKNGATQRVIFQAANPNGPILSNLSLAGAEHVALIGIDFRRSISMQFANRSDPNSARTGDVLVRGGRIQTFFITSVHDITLDGVDIGHYDYSDGFGSNSLYSDNGMPTLQNVTIENSQFRGITAPAGSHAECLFVKRIDGLVLRNNIFLGCPGLAVAHYDANSGPDSGSNTAQNLLYENNFFACGPTTNCYGGGQAMQFDSKGYEKFSNITVRFNSFVGSVYLNGAQTNGRWYGNSILGGTVTCGISGVTYSYNLGIGCGGTNSTAQPVYANPDRITGDYHIGSTSAPQIDFVPGAFCTSAGCPVADIDGDARPNGAAYDAGADES